MERSVPRADDLLVAHRCPARDLLYAHSVYGPLVRKEIHQPIEHGRHTSRRIKVLHVVGPARLDAGQVRDPSGDLIEGAEVDLDPEVGRYRRQVQGGIGGAPYGHVKDDGVGERALGDDLTDCQAFPHQFDDAPSCRPGQLLLALVGG